MYRFGEPACHRWKWQSTSLALVAVFLVLLFCSGVESKAGKDLYKILGVDKQASQADIKKAFHKLSLKYHPDKNPSKDAQVKFTEISNAYDVLSDEQKRTNYDTYGDPAGPTGPTGGPHGWHHQSSGGGGHTFFGSQPHFTFSYGGDSGGASGGFGNMFESFFGGSTFGGNFGGRNQGSSQSQGQRGRRSSLFDSMEGVEKFSGLNFRQQVVDKGKLTWLVLFYNPYSQNLEGIASAVKDVVNSLRGMIKVGVIDCHAERNLCEKEGALPLQDARAFVYPYGGSAPGEYNGGWTAKSLKTFVVTYLPKLSTRLDTQNFLQVYPDYHVLPRVILLTKKKETPAMWRALSGIFDNQVAFFDSQVDDELDPLATRFGVKEFPAVVGVLSNRKESLLVGKDDLEGTNFKFEDLKALIDKLRQESKEAGAKQGGTQSDGHVPFLSKSNFGLICGEDTSLCIFAVVKSAKHAEKMQQIVTEVSQKTLLRQVDGYGVKKSALSYSLVDASKQSSFLQAFGNPKFPKSDTVLLAFKPKRKRFALFKGVLTLEEVESFVTGALGGDVQFNACKKHPVLSM